MNECDISTGSQAAARGPVVPGMRRSRTHRQVSALSCKPPIRHHIVVAKINPQARSRRLGGISPPRVRQMLCYEESESEGGSERAPKQVFHSGLPDY